MKSCWPLQISFWECKLICVKSCQKEVGDMGIDKEELKRLIDERGVESLADLNNLLKEISKEVIGALYEGELTDHLGFDPHTPHAAQVRGNAAMAMIPKPCTPSMAIS